MRDSIGEFDTILLDLFLPSLTSWKLLRSLRTKHPIKDAPALVVTVLSDQAKGVGFRIHDFLLKPVVPEDLITALKWSGILPHTNKKVLIFDDDHKAAQFAKQLLEKFGYKVTCGNTLKSALLAIKKQHPDALLLDPFMSKLKGYELLSQFRKTQRGMYTPIIIWTIKTLSEQERTELRTQLKQRVMLEGEDITKSFLNELKTRHPLLEESNEEFV